MTDRNGTFSRAGFIGLGSALGALSVDLHPVNLRELFLETVQEQET